MIVDFLVILRNKIEGKKMHDLVCIHNAWKMTTKPLIDFQQCDILTFQTRL